jgi:head-tail adaptor
MLSNCELASMREAVTGTFDQTALILTAAETDDGGGGQVTDWDDAASVSVRCAVLRASSPGDGVEGDRHSSDQRRTIRLPYGTVVTSSNRIRVGSATYEVLGVLDDQSFPVSVDVDAKRLT